VKAHGTAGLIGLTLLGWSGDVGILCSLIELVLTLRELCRVSLSFLEQLRLFSELRPAHVVAWS